jgi:hypothetical protein
VVLEFLLMSPGLNSFLLLRDEQNSKYVWVLITNEFHEFC